jgi:hypothetical protein
VTYRSLALCSNKGAYEAIPEPKLRLDLSEARSKLEGAGRPVVDARVMLILPGSPEMTLTRDGKVVIKTSDAEAADRAFRELASLIHLPLA